MIGTNNQRRVLAKIILQSANGTVLITCGNLWHAALVNPRQYLKAGADLAGAGAELWIWLRLRILLLLFDWKQLLASGLKIWDVLLITF